jgi:hypothetical protein
MGNDKAVLNTQTCKHAIQTRSVEFTTFYTRVYINIYIILRPEGSCYGGRVFSFPCNVINSNNIRLVSSNYIHSPPRESLINLYYNVTFTRNLLQAWTHIHRAALYDTGWCTTHTETTHLTNYNEETKRSCKDGGDDGAWGSPLLSYRHNTPGTCYNQTNKVAACKDYSINHGALEEW